MDTIELTFHVVAVVTQSRTWTIVVPDDEIAKVIARLGAPVGRVRLATKHCEGSWHGSFDGDRAEFTCRQHRLPIAIAVLGSKS